MYRLGRRVLSQYIRTGCHRRLRLDLYRGVQDRRAANVPEKDAGRPGLALLVRQGKEYERAKYRELEEVFGELVVRGECRPYDPEEDRAFVSIDLESVIDGLEPHQLVLEAQCECPTSSSLIPCADIAELPCHASSLGCCPALSVNAIETPAPNEIGVGRGGDDR